MLATISLLAAKARNIEAYPCTSLQEAQGQWEGIIYIYIYNMCSLSLQIVATLYQMIMNVMWQEDNVPESSFNISLDSLTYSNVRVDGHGFHASEVKAMAQVHTSINALAAGDVKLLSLQKENTLALSMCPLQRRGPRHVQQFSMPESQTPTM